jgi:hypothetical protein
VLEIDYKFFAEQRKRTRLGSNNSSVQASSTSSERGQ